MVQLVYFLQEYAREGSNGQTRPPQEFGDLNWIEVYKQFFPHLGDGRSFKTFRGSADRLRHGNIRQHKEDGVAFLPKYEAILQFWITQPREEQWADLQKYRQV